MNFNYTMNNIKIKMNWFDLDTDNKFKKFGSKGLNLYFTLFKFRLYKQDNNYLFVTSISLLRKETSYKTEEIFELLKLMKSLGILKFEGLSKWSYLVDENGKVKDKDVLICCASDVPETDETIDENGKKKDIPRTEDDKYINIDLNMIQHYENIGLSERYYAIYSLVRFFCDINSESKCWMSIETMAETLDYDKDALNKMIHEMNRNYILYSFKKKNGKNGYLFEHYLCTIHSNLIGFKNSWVKDGIEKNLKQWDKAKERKAKTRLKKEKQIKKTT